MARPHRHRPAAFSLVELVLAALIVGLLAAVAVPRYAAASANYRLDAAARRVAADLAAARELARARSGYTVVTFDTTTGGVTTYYAVSAVSFVAAASTELADPPYDLQIAAADFGGDGLLSYDGFGRPDNGGTVTLQAGGRQVVVTVDAETGEVSLP